MDETISTKRGRYMNIDEKIYLGELILENYSDDTILTSALLDIGYDETKMQEGRDLLAELRTKITNKNDIHSQQVGTTKILNDAIEKSYEKYMEFVTICKIAFRDDLENIKKLKLDQRKTRRSFSHMQEEIKNFYQEIGTETMLAKLANFGITQEKLNSAIALYENVVNLDRTQETKKGDSQDATQLKSETFEKYNQWIRDIRKLLKIALKDRPQLLEKLKIKA